MIPPWVIAAAAVAAAAVGVASGAYFNGLRWEAKYANLERDHATATANAVTQARQEERDAQLKAAAIRDQPATVRVRCTAEPRAGVPGTGASAPVGDLPDGGTDRDYLPAMREFLAAAIANREMNDGGTTRD